MTWHALLHFLGVDNVSGEPYGWWSGAGSVILPPLLTILGAVALYAFHHQCKERACRRIVRHAPPGLHYCRHHLGAHQPEPAAPVPACSCAQTAAAVRKLSDDVSGLAEVTRAVLLAQGERDATKSDR